MNDVTIATAEYIRPFDVRRDLGAVADLVEQCFADTLDPDGARYLQQMRAFSHNTHFLSWMAAAPEWAGVPMSGYIWEQDDRLIGNISLIPYNLGGRRFYLIANVAVHPEYRRQGIARAMTLRAVEHARVRGAPAVWLHVREENDPAVELYRSLGFIERARRTTWAADGTSGGALGGTSVGITGSPTNGATPDTHQSDGIRIGLRQARHWELQLAWLRKNYPLELSWHLPLNPYALRPGLIGAFRRLFKNLYVRQWSAEAGGRLLGVLTWQATTNYANSLWLAAPPESEAAAAAALLPHARRRLSRRRPLTLDYPAHRAAGAFQAAGFHEHQTLIWMEMPFYSGL